MRIATACWIVRNTGQVMYSYVLKIPYFNYDDALLGRL